MTLKTKPILIHIGIIIGTIIEGVLHFVIYATHAPVNFQ